MLFMFITVTKNTIKFADPPPAASVRPITAPIMKGKVVHPPRLLCFIDGAWSLGMEVVCKDSILFFSQGSLGTGL